MVVFWVRVRVRVRFRVQAMAAFYVRGGIRGFICVILTQCWSLLRW